MIREDHIGEEHSQYTKYCECWELIRDVLDGECVIKENGIPYLPKPSGMDEGAYDEYKSRARFLDITATSIITLVGRLFKKDPTIKLSDGVELPGNLGGIGVDINDLARKLTADVASYARHGLLVDFDEELGHPKIVSYDVFSIKHWHQVNGQLKLLVLEEQRECCPLLEDGHSKCRLLLYLDENGQYAIERCELSNETTGKPRYVRGEPVYPTIAGKRLDYIPFVFVSPFGANCDVARPPLYGLASDAKAWYNTSADKRHTLHLTALATPYIALDVIALDSCPEDYKDMFKDMSVKLGGNGGILPGNSEIKFAEISGVGADKLQQELDDIKQDMLLKAGLISSGNLVNTAAETAIIAQGGHVATLDALAGNISDALTKALRIWAEWAGYKPEEFSFELCKEFFDRKLNPQEITALQAAYNGGIIDINTYRNNLRDAGIIAQKTSNEEIQERVESDTNLL